MNVMKAWKARTARGTSLQFYFCIWIGYVFAMIGKMLLIYCHINVAGTAQVWTEVVKWYVLLFYFLNAIMVSLGILIHFRNAWLDKKAGR